MVTHLIQNEQSKEIYIIEGNVYICFFRYSCHTHAITRPWGVCPEWVLLLHCLSLHVLMLRRPSLTPSCT